MKYLHIAIIEESEECLVSDTEEGLRSQVMNSLAKRSIPPMTDVEWADCVKAETDINPDSNCLTDCIKVSLISYYKIESKIHSGEAGN